MVEKKLTFLMLGRVLALTFAYLLPSASASITAGLGMEARCKNGEPITGVCTSGKNPFCQGDGTALNCGGYKLLDSTYASNYDSLGNDMIGYEYGDKSFCPDGAVAAGVCSSGEHKDCQTNWGKAYSRLWCSQIDTTRMSLLGNPLSSDLSLFLETWDAGNLNFVGCMANNMCSCDPGQVVVGFGASGKSPDVWWFPDNKWHTGIFCQELVCNAGCKNY